MSITRRGASIKWSIMMKHWSRRKTLVIWFWGMVEPSEEKNGYLLGPTPVKSRRSITSAWAEPFLPKRFEGLDFSGTGGAGAES